MYINCAKKTPIAHANDARVGAAKLTGWLVVGRSAGLTVGPFVGGDRVREFPIQWNTGPGWGMAAV